jgi:hypothetical protein
MNADRKQQDGIDSLITEALGSEPGFKLSSTFTDRLVKKVQRHLVWREIFTEFSIKIGIVAGILLILLICLFFPFMKEGNPFLIFLADNRPVVLSVTFIILFIFFIDQVLLKYFFRKQITQP